MTDNGPVYQTLRVHYSRAKLTTRFNDNMPWQKFSVLILEQSASWKYPYFAAQCRTGQISLHAKNQLNMSTRFNRTPTCDSHRQANRETDGQRATASTHASIALHM